MVIGMTQVYLYVLLDTQTHIFTHTWIQVEHFEKREHLGAPRDNRHAEASRIKNKCNG